MEPALQLYAERDPGFKQLCDQYSFVADNPKSREEYKLWAMARMREEGEMETARQIGYGEGHLIRLLEQIHHKIQKSKNREQIINELELADNDINILDDFDNYSHMLKF